MVVQKAFILLKKSVLYGLFFGLVLQMISCGNGKKTENFVDTKVDAKKSVDTASFHKMLQAYYEDSEKLFPVNATSNGDYRYDDQFPVDISESYQIKEQNFYQQYLDSLDHYQKAGLPNNDQVSFAVLDFDLKNSLEGLKFKAFTDMPINQIFSTTLTFAQLGQGQGAQPFKTKKDYKDFLKRMDGFSDWCDTAIGNMKKGLKRNNILPRPLVEKMLPQMEDFMDKDPKKSLFYNPINLIPKTFSLADKDSLTKAYENAIVSKIIPSYTKLHTFLEREYLPKSRKTSGIGALPQSKELYAYSIHNFTTTDLSADSIFNLGLNEVARIHKGIDSIKSLLGYKGTYSQFLKSIQIDPKVYPFKTDKQILDAYQKIYNKEKPYLSKLFGKTPKTGFEIRKTEDFRAKSASAEYFSGTPDGKRPGIFYTPILDPKTYSSYKMETLFLHEAIPGHHFQISLQNENTSLPMFRRFYGNSAYAEGWGLYAESLGKELGEYTDPYMLLGHLGADMHRAIRLVVDAGMHAKGWSREKAIAYALENEPTTEEATIAEIERYMAAPGQALSYKIGALKIKSLRDKYKKILGPKFSISKFHDAILGDGCLPLVVLEENMDRWAESQK